MANKPNKVGEYFTVMKGETVKIFLYGGDVIEEGKNISGVTIRRDTAKGSTVATGITLMLSGGRYIISADKLRELHNDLVKKSKVLEATEFDSFIQDMYRMLKNTSAVNFIKK